MILTRQPPRRRGAALVEFAVVLPLMVFLLLGVWEVGRLIQVQAILSNAAREGARQASAGFTTNGKPVKEADVENAVKFYLRRAGIPDTNVKITVTNHGQKGFAPTSDHPNEARQLDRFEVIVVIPYDDVDWVFTRYFAGGDITAKAHWYSMRDLPVDLDTNPPIE